MHSVVLHWHTNSFVVDLLHLESERIATAKIAMCQCVVFPAASNPVAELGSAAHVRRAISAEPVVKLVCARTSDSARPWGFTIPNLTTHDKNSTTPVS